MKRSELTVGMVVAIKRGYGDGHKATVLSLDKHTENRHGRITVGQGTGLLVRLERQMPAGLLVTPYEEQVVVQPQAVLGEWDAYQARLEAERQAREESYHAEKAKRAAREQAEMDALSLASKHAIPAHRPYSTHTSPEVVLPVEVFAALVAALPQGYTYTAQED